MKRLVCIVGLAICLCALARADDIYIKDPKDTRIVPKSLPKAESGIIEDESPAGIKLKQGRSVDVIAPMTIDRVTYTHSKVDGTTFRAPDNELDKGLDKANEKLAPEKRKKHLEDALVGFEKLAKEVADAERPLRYVRYRIAYTRVMQAREDPTLTKAAIEGLTTFIRAPKSLDGWEAIPALKMLADLQKEQGDIEGASQTLEQMVKLDGLPPEMKQACTLEAAGMLLSTGKYPAAEERLKGAIGNLAADDPQKQRLLAYLVLAQMKQGKATQALADLNKILATAATDPDTRAICHNLLGDYYHEQKPAQDEEAFWHYLRVHVLYKDNPEEHAKALYWLYKLFDSVKQDHAKAMECFEALKREDLARTEFGKKLAKEPPPTGP